MRLTSSLTSNNLYKNLALALSFLAFWVNGMAQSPKYSNEFLAIGVGARALGMSNAFVATVNDATAGYWNPAGLASIEKGAQIALMHAEYFAGIARYDYAGFASKVDERTYIGASLIRFGVDDIPDTSELIDANGNINFDRIKSFSASDYAFLLSLARKMKNENLQIGGNLKIIHRRVGSFATAWGFGVDAGMQYKAGKWKFAAVGRDATNTFNAWSFNVESLRDVFNQTGNEIPQNSLELTAPRLILGAARKFDFSEKFALATEINLVNTFDGKRNTIIKSNFASIDPMAGIEASYSNIVFLRAGIGNFQQYTDINQERRTGFNPNLGVGLRLGKFYIDYALTNVGGNTLTPYSNIFSLRIDLHPKTQAAQP